MRTRIRFVLLLAPALALLGATCVVVTDVRQRGPGGPWTVDVVNTGGAPAYAAVTAQIRDAKGREVSFGSVRTCPGVIPPHGRAGAEILLSGRFYGEPPTPPFSATIEVQPITDPAAVASADALAAHVVERHPEGRFVMVAVENTSSSPRSSTYICATLRGPSGELLEVGNTALFPTTLQPGQTEIVPVYFNTMPPGTIAVFPSGSSACCTTAAIDVSQFHSETEIITGDGDSRFMQVAGEITNNSGRDLREVQMAVFLEGIPQTRVRAVVACGTGVIGRSASAPVVFTLSVPNGVAKPRIVVAGIEGQISDELIPLTPSDVSVTPLGSFSDGVYASGVRARLTNPTPSTLGVVGACATLRGADGEVVGTSAVHSSSVTGAIGAEGTLAFASLATSIARPSSADIVAYGLMIPPPPPGRLPGY